MRVRFYPLVVLLIGINIFTASCLEKGSLTFVIDNTLSMGSDIYQVKQSADAITKIVFEEKSSRIKNMVLVTFNDPHAILRINTESRSYFKNHIHDISVGNPYGNIDCAEPSMNGVLLGLQTSLPGSFIYVFTDASAKDFWKSHEIKNLCQKKQTQITFVLTGRCYGPLEAFQVYYDIATACSGFAFRIGKDDVDKVLTTIKETISGNKTVITAIKTPPRKYTNVPFVIDDQTEYAIITASGSSVILSVSGPQAVQEQVMWIKNAKAIKLSYPTPGNYTARVKGRTETSVHIVGRTDFLFSHGFSELEPKTLKDTTPQPIADAKTHLSIIVTDPKHTVTMKSAQILDMNERVLKELPLKRVANDFYITTPFVAPSKSFKVSVIGKAVRDGKDIKRIGKIPVTPQDPPKVIPKSKKPVIGISEGKLTEVEYGKTIKLTCKVSAYPEPKITWKNGRGATLKSQSSVVELPYEYISYLTITDVLIPDTYSCHAGNNKGTESKTIELVVKEPFDVKSAVKGQTEFQYGKRGTLKCDIKASVPMHIYWSYENEKTGLSRQLSTSGTYEISADGKVLNINKMELNMVGKYTCKASLDRDSSKFVIFSTQVKISGLVLPKITAIDTMNIRKGSNVAIECHINGVPRPTITWEYMAKDDSNFVSIRGSDYVLRISSADEKHAGRYKCIAHNVVGNDEHVTTLTVLVPPKISSISSVYKSIEEKDALLRIPCAVTGLPKPVITWITRGAIISQNNKYSIEDGALVIKSPNVSDSQTYTCEAKNDAGADHKRFQAVVLQAPKVSGEFTKTAITESAVDIECTISKGVPKPKITWQYMAKDDSKFVFIRGLDSVLRISNVEEKHAGRYKCIAHNDAGKDEHVTTLTVLASPKITSSSSVIYKSVEDRDALLRIPCAATGLPKPVIKWSVDGVTIAPNNKYSIEDGALVIKNPKVGDSQTYRCEATNAAGSVHATLRASVLQVPKVSGKTTKKAIIGTSVKIECIVVNVVPKPTITWQYMAKDASKFVSIQGSNSVLRISNVEEKHAGRYKCIAHNDVGNDEHVTTLTVQSPPKITSSSSVIHKSVEEKDALLRIPCAATGLPKPVIKWTVNGATIAENDKYSIEDGALIIKNPKVSDSQTYRCEATNDAGSVHATFQASVLQVPRVSGKTTKKAIKGTSVKIECIVVNVVPKPTITWQYMAKDASKFVSIQGSDNVLRISSVEDKHAGRYKCIAHNDVGNDEHVTTLTVQSPPKITSSSSVIHKSVEEKDALLRIPCAATGLPKPVIKWTVNGATIAENDKYSIEDGALIIKNPKVSDSQTYRCEATNDAGSVHATFQASVLQVPRVSGKTTKKAITGTSVKIECIVVNVVPKPTITWQYMGKDDSDFVAIRGSDNVLRISSVEEKHAGRYKCIAHNDVGNDEHVTTLTVQSLPKITSSSSVVYKSVEEKDPLLRIPCAATGLPKPAIKWTVNGATIAENDKYSIEDGALIIKNPKVSDSQTYRCEATNDAGSVHATFQASVLQVPRVSGKTTKKAITGTSVKIECIVVNVVPKPTITWQYMGKDDSDFVAIRGSDNVLRISSVEEKHAGRYKCIAHNDVGNDEHVTTLTVQSPPKITSSSSVVYKSVEEKDPLLRIPCAATGLPKPAIKWTVNGATIAENDKYSIEDGALVIKNPNVSDSQTYRCEATNDAGSVYTMFKADVLRSPKISSSSSVIYKSIEEKDALLRIPCAAIGLPKPVVTWTVNGAKITETEKYSFQDGDLIIKNPKVSDSQTYICEATNDAGSVQATFKASVLQVPTVSGDTTKSAITGSSVTIECTIGKGIPKPTIAWQYMAKDDTKFLTIPESDNVIRISGVEEKHAGRYKCIAHNDVGNAEHVTTLTVLAPPKITSSSSIIYKSVEEKDAQLRIPCAANGLPKPAIKWTMNGATISQNDKYSIEDGALIIKNPKVKDSQTYRCEATNDAGSVYATFKADVLQVPRVSGETTKRAITGTFVYIECTIVNGVPKPSITWQFMAKNDKEFVTKPGSDNVIRIWGVEEKNAGRYKCIVHNDVGNDEHVTTLTVLAPPKILSSSSVIYKSVEEKDALLRIPCVVTGLPKPVITWTVNSANITESEQYSIEDGALIIKNPKVSDSQTYRCEATNDAGSVHATFQADVLQAPKITGLDEKTVRSGDSVEIECTVVKGVPAPTITWQFMGEHDSKFISMPGSENKLYMSRVDKKYTGRYKCVAQNDAGADKHVTTLTVQFAPVVTAKTNTTYKGLQGDVALRIPCDATGVPQPVITWKTGGAAITPNARYTIIDGALIIKDPKKEDSKLYVCEAKNFLGVTEITFIAEIDTELEDYGTIKEVNILQGTAMKFECESDSSQSVRWFMEGNDMKIHDKYFNLNNVDVTNEGNYTCRVSDMNGAHTLTYAVVVGFAPEFSFEQEETLFDWNGSEYDMLDCQVESKPPSDVVWTYNGEVLSGQQSQLLALSANWGHYTCNVSNVHGAVQKSFDVTSSNCLIKRKPENELTMPLLLNQNSTWPVVDSTKDYLNVAPGQIVTFSCPSDKDTKNGFQKFPTVNEVTASCDKQDIFLVDGKPYKVSDLHCASEINAIVHKKHEKCLTDTSELMRVGYDVHGFLESYEVCFDTSKNIPLYTRVLMSKSNRGPGITHSWYKYPGIGGGKSDVGYVCADSTSSCCYNKTQLVNVRDFSDGPAQRSTYIDPLNAVPYWHPCDKAKDPWDNIENMIRAQLSTYSQFIAWSGTHKLQEKNGQTIPRYLWKVIRFDEEDSIAVVYVNDPSPVKKDIMCTNICVDDNVPWLRDLDERTYCCEVNQFLQAFGLRGTSIGESLDRALDKITSMKY